MDDPYRTQAVYASPAKTQAKGNDNMSEYESRSSAEVSRECLVNS